MIIQEGQNSIFSAIIGSDENSSQHRMEINLPEGLTVMEFPESHRRLLRTTIMIERLNNEIRRRTRVVTIFPNVAYCQRLINAILMEVDEEWQIGKRYLTFPKLEEQTT